MCYIYIVTMLTCDTESSRMVSIYCYITVLSFLIEYEFKLGHVVLIKAFFIFEAFF